MLPFNVVTVSGYKIQTIKTKYSAENKAQVWKDMMNALCN